MPKFLLARIQPRRRAASPADALLRLYIERLAAAFPSEIRDFPDEPALLDHLDRAARRTRPALILTDARGQQLTSTAYASALKSLLDRGIQELVLAVGPPDGWSPAALARADLTLAFGKITLPHELAAVILAEQTYRASTIWAGHPYHSGH